ncbi:hypothetical protein DSL72_004752 [Monilinia vaccinii-corymbosi]|uniref:Major facilitator superfamily (MFS) profile domain-containing protein n=1 Tax=Monilinia vaccinii-corymbosi TaxID=61207 RepID=A0A8A3P1B8_9HELO|nr:hypothetical protein DSL72_004752 [Monilinia vaccinii-corymbosi]
MADVISRRETGKSGASRPDSPPGLNQCLSGNHLDDTSYYTGHPGTSQERTDQDTEHGSSVAEKQRKGGDGDDDDDDDDDSEDTDTDASISPEVIDGIEVERDIEASPKLRREKTQRSSRSVRDPNLVSWEGPNDPENPKNWTTGRKWAATLVVSSFTFISPVSSSMVAPALASISSDLNIVNSIEQSLVLSIFVLAYAVDTDTRSGPLFLGPLSEVFGRVIVLQISNLLYLFFNLGCGLAQTKEQLIAFRFLSGLGGSAPLALGGGVLGDLFAAEERGKAISIYSLAPLLGPAIGPIAGGFIAENTTWRWVFYATTIADALIQIIGLFFLQETFAPVLLGRKKQKLIQETGNQEYHTEWDVPNRSLATKLRISLTRPFKLLGTQIIVQVLALYMSYLYGLVYLVLSTFPRLWEDVYNESIGIGGLNYISAPCQDLIYRALKARNNGVGKPEFRVPLMIPGALLVPVGLFWYGWSAQAKTHWIVPNIGAAIFSAGTIIGFQCIQTYLVDTYTTYAASAVAAATVMRSLAGFGFPLFAPYMYAALDNGWGNSLLGFIAIVLGWPAPILFWMYGEKLRSRSAFAAG